MKLLKDPLDLGLAEAYWTAADSGLVGLDSGHTPAKQIALYKFVRLAGDLLMPSLYVPYVQGLVFEYRGCCRLSLRLLQLVND